MCHDVWSAYADRRGRRPIRRDRLIRSVAMIALAVVQSGCGPAGPATQAVSGVVTLDGKPVEGATVTFSPSSSTGAFASGITKADGRFSLNAAVAGAKAGAGTLVGEYRVSVLKVESPEVSRTDDPNAPGYDPLASVTAKPAAPKYVVPKAYGDPAASGLSAKVEKGGGSFDFALKSSYTGP